jgi:hypothetical protein
MSDMIMVTNEKRLTDHDDDDDNEDDDVVSACAPLLVFMSRWEDDEVIFHGCPRECNVIKLSAWPMRWPSTAKSDSVA